LPSGVCVMLPGMRFVELSRRLLPPLLALLALLVLAPAAMAADGVGTYGRTDDKVVTFFAFGLIAFFAILVTVLSLIQIRLENRKQRRTEDLERLGSR
jgi:putative copper export protein